MSENATEPQNKPVLPKWQKGVIFGTITTILVFVLMIIAFMPLRTSNCYELQTSNYTDTTDVFYFLDFKNENDYKEVSWTAPVDVQVILMTYNQFCNWYYYDDHECIRVLVDIGSESFYFSDLPSQSTSSPDNTLVILFDSVSTRTIEIEINNYYWIC